MISLIVQLVATAILVIGQQGVTRITVFTLPVVGLLLASLLIYNRWFRTLPQSDGTESKTPPPVDDVLDTATERVRSNGIDGGASAEALDRARFERAEDRVEAARRHAVAAIHLTERETELQNTIATLDRRLTEEIPGDRPKLGDKLDETRERLRSGKLSDARSIVSEVEEEIQESILVHHGRGVRRLNDAIQALDQDQYERARMAYSQASDELGRARSIIDWRSGNPAGVSSENINSLNEQLSELRAGPNVSAGSAEEAIEAIDELLAYSEEQATVSRAQGQLKRAKQQYETAQRRNENGNYDQAIRKCDEAIEIYQSVASTGQLEYHPSLAKRETA